MTELTEGSDMSTDHGQGALDVVAIRARAETATHFGGVTQIVADDTLALLVALAARDAEVEQWKGEADDASIDAITQQDRAEAAEAALAAVADAPGLEEVLLEHRLNFAIDGGEECQDDDWDGSGAYEIHLADVVRAWLRGETT